MCRSRNYSLSPISRFLPAFFTALLTIAADAAPFSQATVTRVENKVSFGQIHQGQSKTRPAAEQDIVHASDFVLTQDDSRAELKYDDGSLVRIGQNSVFSFEANSRTLSLEKGTFIFSIPKGSGGGTIKTPSLAAAITGTIGKVSGNTIAIVEGTIKLVPSGQLVSAGQFARRNADGSITIGTFDPKKSHDGKLMTFNGPLPGLPEAALGLPTFSLEDVHTLDSMERVINSPSGLTHFFPPILPKATPAPVVATPTPVPPTPPPPTPPPIFSGSPFNTGG